MLDRGSYFSGQARDEKVVLFRKRHWIPFLPWVLISLFLLLVVPWVAFYTLVDYLFDISSFSSLFSQKPAIYWLIISYGMWGLVVLAVFLYAWMNYYLNTTIITTEHLVDVRQNGWFNHKVAEQSLLRVQDVSSNMRGIWQTFFRYGKIVVETAGDTPNFEIPNIPQPYKVANTIMKLHQELVASGGHNPYIAEAEGVLKPGEKRTEESIQPAVAKSSQPKPVQEEYFPSSPSPATSNEKIPLKESLPTSLQGNLDEGKTIQLP